MKIGFTNGIFDVIHIGHIRSFWHYKQACDYLIVGINSDRATKILKGNSRPINNEEHRKELLESIKYIDNVFIFDDINVIGSLKEINPDYWFKSSDYSLDKLNQEERKIAEVLGIEIIFTPFIEGLSSTNILNKI